MRCSCLAILLCVVMPACSRQHGEGQTRNASDVERASGAQATQERAAASGESSMAAEAWEEPEEELEPVELPAPRSEAETASLSGPVEQGTSERDRRVTQQIRRALIEDEKLSFTAKNARIITRDGDVTLRGQVISTQERRRVEEIARQYAAQGSVDNQLELKNSSSTSSSEVEPH